MTVGAELRRTEQGDLIDARLVRDFLRAALDHDAARDAVDDLLFEHVVARRYHLSVVAASLRPILTEILDAATAEDWSAVGDELIADARDALAGDEHPPALSGDGARR